MKLVKRGYNFSENLLEEWKQFHFPAKQNYSASAAAAFLLYMTLDANVREQLQKLASQEDIKSAREQAKNLLQKSIVGQSQPADFTG